MTRLTCWGRLAVPWPNPPGKEDHTWMDYNFIGCEIDWGGMWDRLRWVGGGGGGEKWKTGGCVRVCVESESEREREREREKSIPVSRHLNLVYDSIWGITCLLLAHLTTDDLLLLGLSVWQSGGKKILKTFFVLRVTLVWSLLMIGGKERTTLFLSKIMG